MLPGNIANAACDDVSSGGIIKDARYMKLRGDVNPLLGFINEIEVEEPIQNMNHIHPFLMVGPGSQARKFLV